MRLLDDYRYLDDAQKTWPAPKESVVDGASIPQFLWSFIGGPFEGLYRKASVVHDVACDKKADDWRAVHRMFYEAMLCSGVSSRRAQVMYEAVYQCGPRWGANSGVRLFPCGDFSMRSVVRRLKTWIGENTLTLAELEDLTPQNLTTVQDPIDQLRENLTGAAEVVENERGTFVVIRGFGSGQAAAPGERRALDALATLSGVPGVKLTVESFTDDRGAEEFNQALSRRRANRLADGLLDRGFAPDQVQTTPYGEVKPGNAATAAERSRNRRVQILIVDEL